MSLLILLPTSIQHQDITSLLHRLDAVIPTPRGVATLWYSTVVYVELICVGAVAGGDLNT